MVTSAAPIWWVGALAGHVRGGVPGGRGREWRPTSVLHDGRESGVTAQRSATELSGSVGPPPTAAATQPPRGPAVATLAPCAHSREDPHPTRWSGGAWSRPDGCTPTGWSSSPGTGSSRSARPKRSPPRAAHPALPVPAEPQGTVLPGLVDLHCHGGGGFAFTAGDDEQVAGAARHHLGRGTTSVVAGVVTDEPERMLAAVAAAARAADRGLVAAVLVEGPFLASGHCGAQDPGLLRRPDPGLTRELLDAGRGHVRVMTLAPELPGAEDVVDLLVGRGVVAAVGHTAADADLVRRTSPRSPAAWSPTCSTGCRRCTTGLRTGRRRAPPPPATRPGSSSSPTGCTSMTTRSGWSSTCSARTGSPWSPTRCPPRDARRRLRPGPAHRPGRRRRRPRARRGRRRRRRPGPRGGGPGRRWPAVRRTCSTSYAAPSARPGPAWRTR